LGEGDQGLFILTEIFRGRKDHKISQIEKKSKSSDAVKKCSGGGMAFNLYEGRFLMSWQKACLFTRFAPNKRIVAQKEAGRNSWGGAWARVHKDGKHPG